MPNVTVTVTYQGHAQAVVGPDGIAFVRGQPVEVPADLAATLGSAFVISRPGKDPASKKGGQ